MLPGASLLTTETFSGFRQLKKYVKLKAISHQNNVALLMRPIQTCYPIHHTSSYVRRHLNTEFFFSRFLPNMISHFETFKCLKGDWLRFVHCLSRENNLKPNVPNYMLLENINMIADSQLQIYICERWKFLTHILLSQPDISINVAQLGHLKWK